MNVLQLRDWSIDFCYGNIPPEQLTSSSDKAGSCIFWTENLRAIIWVNKKVCKDDNQDPLNVVLHEIAHVWLCHEEDEERQANVLALLLENQIVKEKK
jgi:Mlc titration factor MtfA (ptsG expression regulator)